MADSKITALASISTSTDPAVDPLVIVDVSDTSMAASGTSKKVTLNNLLSSSPTATGNFTITGDLTAARLIVTGGTIPTNGLWLATTNTLEFAANSLAQYRIAPLGVFSWFDGAGGTRMTLNSTGLGVGVSPSAKLHVDAGTSNEYFRGAGNSGSARYLVITASTTTNAGDTHTINASSVSGVIAFAINATERARIDANGNLILLSSNTPATLATNGQLTVNATSNTNLRFSYRGSDGTTRVANLTLA